MKRIPLLLTLLLCHLAILGIGQNYTNNSQIFKDYSKQEPKINGANIYRSEENKYRVKVPDGWSINRPNSIGVEFNSQHPFEIASMNILVGSSVEIKNISVYDIPVNRII